MNRHTKRIIYVFVFCILFCFLRIPSIYGYNNPKPEEGLSAYFNFRTQTIDKIDVLDCYASPITSAEANVPLKYFSEILEDFGLYISADFYGSIIRIIGTPFSESYSLHLKHHFYKSGSFNTTLFTGIAYNNNILDNSGGLSLDTGIILGYDVFDWIRLYSPLTLSFYSDGFAFNTQVGIRPYAFLW